MFIVRVGLLIDKNLKEKKNLNFSGTNRVKKLGALGLSSPHPDGTVMLAGTWRINGIFCKICRRQT